MVTEADRCFMALALELAEKGRGYTSPNPMVGAVLVREGVIVGRGYHMRAGEDHAEVIALREAGDQAAGATLYVTMEPCCHHGKTPPCSDAVIRSGVLRVVAAMTDPNPKVCGGGFARLAHSGVGFVTGVLEERARKLNEAYIKYITSGIPYVTLKLAVTLDGKIAARDGSSKWITGPEARKRTHLLRAWSDAVMVGSGTVLADDPQLTVRDAGGRNPLRVVLDSRLRVPAGARVFSDNRVIVATAASADPDKTAELERRGVEVWRIGSEGRIPLSETLARLGSRQITSILCEGGGALASSLVKEKLADKLALFMAPKLLGNGIDAFGDIGVSSIGEALTLREMETESIGDDVLVTGYPEYR
ncbi:MAG: bifunctional diaminohydroxyphosphoribosylaminopyrimidine deaminase/5-amino-6-(5-phosphoribosylamino)uracil reductase RibD [Candidatus Latescibacterota bacterium]